jgi:hypothetical protein
VRTTRVIVHSTSCSTSPSAVRSAVGDLGCRTAVGGSGHTGPRCGGSDSRSTNHHAAAYSMCGHVRAQHTRTHLTCSGSHSRHFSRSLPVPQSPVTVSRVPLLVHVDGILRRLRVSSSEGVAGSCLAASLARSYRHKALHIHQHAELQALSSVPTKTCPPHSISSEDGPTRR